MTDEIMSFVETCTYEEAAAVISAVSSIRMRIAHRFSDKMKAARLRNLEAAESSPNKKTASRANIAKARESIAPESRRANMAGARLSLASARIVKKLGREPMPGDLVEFRGTSYVFGRLENGELGVSVVDRKTDLVTAALLWIDGKLVRKMFE
jgi:hypothetical protein